MFLKNLIKIVILIIILCLLLYFSNKYAKQIKSTIKKGFRKTQIQNVIESAGVLGLSLPKCKMYLYNRNNFRKG